MGKIRRVSLKPLSAVLTPRASVFSDSVRDDVLNLTDFAEGRIDAEQFFAENCMTLGMKMLIKLAFRRFSGMSEAGVVELNQTMGGGKTHDMLALALMASDEKLREQIMPGLYTGTDAVRVVVFSGREHAEYGIWGSIADQLGAGAEFHSLRAPGESEWTRMLEGGPVLILLDELAPYLENAESIAVGNSDLCRVTASALENLFSALGKEQLSRVCLVFSSLQSAHEDGSRLLSDLKQEANRVSVSIDPCCNESEIYSILRKRLFEPAEDTGKMDDAKQAAMCVYRGEINYLNGIESLEIDDNFVHSETLYSYPFHWTTALLYQLFKKNRNFQPLRGLIRLMRQTVRYMWESGKADRKYLISLADADLSRPVFMSMYQQINPSLADVIAHDIASGNGTAVAEVIDSEHGWEDCAQVLAKYLLLSSLSDSPQDEHGLSEADLLACATEPGASFDRMKTAVSELRKRCWYLQKNQHGQLFFQNERNLSAEVDSLAGSYSTDDAVDGLRRILAGFLAPKNRECYQKVQVFPALDEIRLDEWKVTLVVSAPCSGFGLHPDLQAFYDRSEFRNRVMFLTGSRDMTSALLSAAKRLLAARCVLQRKPQDDPQHAEASELADRLEQTLCSLVQQAFDTLYVPTGNGLMSYDIRLDINGNGEEQITAVLLETMKFEHLIRDDRGLDILRKKCEKRLFTAREMTFRLIIHRAAVETKWQWYPGEQLGILLDWCLEHDLWRNGSGGYLSKGPFGNEPTRVSVHQTGYNAATGEFTVRVTSDGGDVFYSTCSVVDSSRCTKVEGSELVTRNPHLWFACIDPEGKRMTGPVAEFIGIIQWDCVQNGLQFEFTGADLPYTIRYSVDGSNPVTDGIPYEGPFNVSENCRFVRSALLIDGKTVGTKDTPVCRTVPGAEWKKIDPKHPVSLVWTESCTVSGAENVRCELSALAGAMTYDPCIAAGSMDPDESGGDCAKCFWTGAPVSADSVRQAADIILDTCTSEEITLTYSGLQFNSGSDFEDWLSRTGRTMEELCRDGAEIV